MQLEAFERGDQETDCSGRAAPRIDGAPLAFAGNEHGVTQLSGVPLDDARSRA